MAEKPLFEKKQKSKNGNNLKENALVKQFKKLPRKQKVVIIAVATYLCLAIISGAAFMIAQVVNDTTEKSKIDKYLSMDNGISECKEAVRNLEKEMNRWGYNSSMLSNEIDKVIDYCSDEYAEEAREKAEEKEQVEACKNKTSEDGKGYSWNYSDEKCGEYETEKSCELKGLKLYSSECVTEEVYKQKKAEEAERKAKEEAEKKAKEEAERKAKEEAEQKAKQQSSPSSSSSSSSSAPSLSEISDACWAYGQIWGVPLTDYASTTVTKDGDYYQILMWHKDKSVWKCWYNPKDKDVFVEKKY